MAGQSAWPPPVDTLTLVVAPVASERTKASRPTLAGGAVGDTGAPFVSPGTRLVAPDRKATKRPSALISPKELCSLPSAPVLDTLTRVVVTAWRSCTKTSSTSLVSAVTRLEADEW